MPNFSIVANNVGYGPLESRVWTDPPTATRPSRITSVLDRQHRRLVIPVNSTLELLAILNSAVGAEPETVTGKILSWVIEYPAPTKPVLVYPTAGYSSIAHWTIALEGHYLFGMQQVDDGSGGSSAFTSGAVLIHVDAYTNPS